MALRTSSFAFVAVAALLTACSGGGGGGGGPSTPPSSGGGTPPPPPAPPPPAPTGTASVSGLVLADPILFVDSDLNDTAGGNVPNDTISAAQMISSDAEVRGWVNCTGRATGSTPCFAGSDQEDFYEVDLVAGQRISLNIADFDPNTPDELDLDLYLYDQNGELITFSFDFASKIEQIVVPEDGTYYVLADAFAGGSNYILTITAPSSTTPQPTRVDMARLAPERLVMVEPTAAALPEEVVAYDTRRTFSRRAADNISRPRQVHLPIGSQTLPESGPFSASFAEEMFGTRPDALSSAAYRAKLALLHKVKVTNAAAGRAILEAYHYPEMHAVAPPPDESLQWNLGAVFWQEALTDIETQLSEFPRPLVAVLDSGVMSAHPKIAPVLVDQRDFVPSFIDGDGFDAEAEESVDPNDPNGDECFDFHGTHVATIATAPREGDPIRGRNMVGGYPHADLMMLKLGYNQGDQCRLIVGDVPAAIRYAAGLPNNSGALPARRADVINLSFGGGQPDSATRAAIEEAVAEGVIIVASAGNDGDTPDGNLPNYPAAVPDVIAVAATDINNARAGYSSFYPQVEVAAPGGEASTDSNLDGFSDAIIGGVGRLNGAGDGFVPRYALYQGTSMAAPHAAAGFAIMKGIYPELTSEQAHRLIEEGLLTNDIGDAGRDNQTGFGLLDFRKMVDVAFQLREDSLNLPPDFRLDPPFIAFGNIGETETINVTRSGDPDFTIDSVTLSIDGATAPVADPTPIDVDAEGFGSYEVKIDRADFSPGDYVGQVTVASSDGDEKVIPVSFEIPLPSLEARTAPARLFLEEETVLGFTPVETLIVEGGAGGSFAFENVEAGSYRLRFTTDMDNDGDVCDPGELGGSFPGVDCFSGEEFEITDDEEVSIDVILRRLAE